MDANPPAEEGRRAFATAGAPAQLTGRELAVSSRFMWTGQPAPDQWPV